MDYLTRMFVRDLLIIIVVALIFGAAVYGVMFLVHRDDVPGPYAVDHTVPRTVITTYQYRWVDDEAGVVCYGNGDAVDCMPLSETKLGGQ